MANERKNAGMGTPAVFRLPNSGVPSVEATFTPPAVLHLPDSGVLSVEATFSGPEPSHFATFTMDNFGISDTRSRHEDTDFVYLSATVGANPPVFVQKSMGE